MTPQDKATFLVIDFIEDLGLNGYLAKQCALIAVDEILNIKGNLNFDYVWYEQRETDIDNYLDNESIKPVRMNAFEYWTKVKQEIEKV
jgi:hypothetical protein